MSLNHQKIKLAPFSEYFISAPWLALSVLSAILLIGGLFLGVSLSVLWILVITCTIFMVWSFKRIKSNPILSFNDQYVFVYYAGIEDRWSYDQIALMNRTRIRYTVFSWILREYKIVHKSNETVYFVATKPKNFEMMLKQLMKINPKCPIYI